MPQPTVRLPDTPFWSNETVVESPALLDGLAAEYAAERGGRPLEMERFLYGRVPVLAFDRIFTGSLDELPTPGLLWIFYLSGYYGGVWLRGEIDAAQPASQLAGVAIPPGEDGFRAMVAKAREACEASRGSDERVVAYCEASLFPSGAVGVTDGLVENFGYNLGYLLEILESPPAGLRTPEAYGVQARGPLACSYDSPKLAALSRFRDVEKALASGANERYRELAERIAPVQEAGVAKGRGVWSSGLSVQGFGQAAYDQLLDVSSSYLEDVQATALATVRCVAEGDAEVGRRAAVANAAMGVWLPAYSAGLLEGRSADAVPSFEGS